MSAEEIEDSYPLSAVQEGMLLHGMSSIGAGSYVQQAICDLRETIDALLIERAWNNVIDRHAVLRTALHVDGVRDPVQHVLRHVDVSWEREDWSRLTLTDQETRFDAYLEADRQRDFDPKRPPLMRLAMFRLASEHFRLVWTYHHALLDGRAVRVILREVFDRYDAFRASRDLSGDARASGLSLPRRMRLASLTTLLVRSAK